MDQVPWNAAAMLTGRNIRTHAGTLENCVSALLSLPDHQRPSARIIVPGCISLGCQAAVRTLSDDHLSMLARRLSCDRAAATAV